MAIKRESIADVLKTHAKTGLVAGSLRDVIKPVDGLTTGNLAIDHITGVGGFPVGRIVELYGHNSCGKTTTALQTAAALQKKILESGSDDCILYMDFEHALDSEYALSLGFDLDDSTVVWAQPETLEAGGNFARDLIATGKVRLMIWDSVAEAQPDAVIAAKTGQSQVAIRAKIMSQFLQQINHLLYNHDCTAIFLNHIQVKIDMTGVKSDTTPGGDALKFYSSVRMKFVQVSKQLGKRFNPLTNSNEDFTVSANTKVTVIKNKVAPPQKSCLVRVRYGKGFDNFWSAIQVLIAYKKITNSGAFFYFDRTEGLAVEGLPTVSGRPAFKGEDNMLSYAEGHTEWRDLIIAAAVDVVNNADPSEMAEVSEDGFGVDYE